MYISRNACQMCLYICTVHYKNQTKAVMKNYYMDKHSSCVAIECIMLGILISSKQDVLATHLGKQKPWRRTVLHQSNFYFSKAFFHQSNFYLRMHYFHQTYVKLLFNLSLYHFPQQNIYLV